MNNIAIIGLGYVGLPLGLRFAEAGVSVIGLDIDPAKVEALNAGRSYIKHIPADTIARARSSGHFEASTDFSRIRDCHAVIICVPTPLNKYREPDISYVLESGKAIAPYLGGQSVEGRGQEEELVTRHSSLITHHSSLVTRHSSLVTRHSSLVTRHSSLVTPPNTPPRDSASLKTRPSALPTPHSPKLVVLESTTYPGTTDGELREVLEAGSGLKAGEGFHLAFSPEREDPGRSDHSVRTIPKVMGGYTPACLERCVALYSQAIDTCHPVGSCRVAEAAKLTENIFRSVNIALVNELKVVYHEMGIDVWDVINAAATKPFGYMPFYPGPGLGGHCIPIDPFYLTWKAREVGQHTRFIELAGEINTHMPDYVIARVAEALNDQRKSVNGARILLLGIAYKPNVDDDRESPSYVLMKKLEQMGASVAYNDPHVPVIRMTREHSEFAGRQSVDIRDAYDCILLATHHNEYKQIDFSAYTCPLVDTRNCVTRRPSAYYPA